jgi:hypothetical protein
VSSGGGWMGRSPEVDGCCECLGGRKEVILRFCGWARNRLHLAVKIFYEILNRNLEMVKNFCRRGGVGLDWINLAQDRGRWQIIVKTKIDFRVS